MSSNKGKWVHASGGAGAAGGSHACACVLLGMRTLQGSCGAAHAGPWVLPQFWGEGVGGDVPGPKQKLQRVWGLRSARQRRGLCANESRVDGLEWTPARRKGACAGERYPCATKCFFFRNVAANCRIKSLNLIPSACGRPKHGLPTTALAYR